MTPITHLSTDSPALTRVARAIHAAACGCATGPDVPDLAAAAIALRARGLEVADADLDEEVRAEVAARLVRVG